ncbi:MAG: Multidrug export protein EmrA [Chlamydiae bacterium]|nr:Multidrug export protein EmrA [Chlamydiota bacterium]
MNEEAVTPHKNRKKILWGIGIGFIAITIGIFFLWLFIWRFEEYTRDAYVHGNQVVVTSQIPGYITEVTVDDTQVVEEGRVLIQLDTIDQKLAFESAKNTMAETVRNVVSLFEKVGTFKADKEIRKAEFSFAAKEYQHRKKLLPSGSVSKENFQQAEARFIEAFAAYIGADHALRGAEAQVENTTIPTHPLVKRAEDAVRESYVNFQRCTIRSASNGIVAMKKAQVGESISLETPLMMIVPLNEIWVNANFKETQLKKVRVGQPVKLTSDIYGGDVVYHGEVVGLSAGTGSVLSVLPPQNATGNWIKIVQRLPVRVRLEPSEIKRNPLHLGLSMNVTIDIHDTSGKMIPAPMPPGALYSTDIFEKQDEGVDQIVQKILEQNITLKETDDGN